MILDKLSLEGKAAIVTGGGTGLGKAMCLALAEAGADVVIGARRLPLIEQTAEEIRARGRKALAVRTDVTDSRDCNNLVDRTCAEFGKVDILVNNAGGGGAGAGKTLFELTDDDWRLGIDTNITGTFYMSRAAAKVMAQQKRGKIVNVASGFGLRGGRNNFMYTSAKAGVINLTRSLALTLIQDNIQVNAIAPGWLWNRGPVTSEEEKEQKHLRGRFTPLGRLGEAEEMGPLCVFLASDASNYMTGELITIDGGGLYGGIGLTGMAPVVPLQL
jgi:NAD(P)-dependent dehydrogenase (short-subunit alcohol dehydrogenase family)